jgi:hypothetical protein
MKPHSYEKLGESGFVDEDRYVESGDVVIGKCMPQKQQQVIVNRDTSVALKSNERGYIDRNYYGNRHFTNVTGDGYTFAKVRIRQERSPTIGDKVSCYTRDHEVLTEAHGWVAIGEVDPALHRVASLTHAGTLAYVAPVSVTSSRHLGDLVHVRGDGVDLIVTPDHRLWAAFDAAAAAGGGGDERPAFGVVRADAAACVGRRGVLQLKSLPSSRRGGLRPLEGRPPVRCDAVDLVQLGGWLSLAASGGSSGSTPYTGMPPWVWALGADDAAWVVIGMFSRFGQAQAQGQEQERPGCELVVRSHLAAGDVQRLCLHAGAAADVLSSPDPAARPRVRVVDAGVAGDGARRGVCARSVATFVRQQHAGPREGCPVYCLTVPPEQGPGVVYVRRNGCAVWCGNSRHGQKGTVGMLYREEDMPFSASGMIPSLIMNPHAIPSRMTIGQLLEALESKSGALRGSLGDGTPFNGRTMEDIAEELEGLGAQRYGDEIMYNPRTGEQMPCAVFLCPTYYQRLKHMVEDKVHCLREDHEVLTEDGWKPIAEVTLEDRVATLHGGRVLAYERPTSVHRYPNYDGLMYRVSSASGVDLDVTLEHRMLVSYLPCSGSGSGSGAGAAAHAPMLQQARGQGQPPLQQARGQGQPPLQQARLRLVEAGQVVGRSVRYKRDAEWTAPGLPAYVLPAALGMPARAVSVDAWLVVFGVWVACGGELSQSKHTFGQFGAFVLIAGRGVPHVAAVLDPALAQLGLPMWCTTDRHVMVDDAQLYTALEPFQWGRLPSWVWRLSAPQASQLLSAVMLAEGRGCLTTDSEALADDVQRLALHAGCAAVKRPVHTMWQARWRVDLVDPAPEVVPSCGSSRRACALGVAALAGCGGSGDGCGSGGCSSGDGGGSGLDGGGVMDCELLGLLDGGSGAPSADDGEVYLHRGAVYCLSVPGEVFYVRRAGKPVWTGNSRAANGPVVLLTRQPAEGRARDGGLRLGEMELECLWAHGSMYFLKERFMECSDNYRVFVCRTCGMMANVNPEMGIYSCKACKNVTEFAELRVPYASKLLLQEVQTMSIGARFAL